MFKLTIETDNAAFADDLLTEEVSRILRHVADRVDDSRTGGPIMDANGNRVGQWILNP